MPKRKGKIAVIITFSVLAGVFGSLHFIINSQTVQKAALGLLASKDIKLEFSNINIGIFPSKITAKNIHLETKTQAITADEAKIRYNLFGFLGGKLALTQLEINGVSIEFKPPAEKTAKKDKISIKKLLLLQSLSIEDGIINNIIMKFPGDKTILADTLGFKFKPHLSGDVTLQLNLQGANYSSKRTSASAGMLALEGKTKLNDWADATPYVNSINGRIRLQDLSYEKISIKSLAAGIVIKDQKFQVLDFKLTGDTQDEGRGTRDEGRGTRDEGRGTRSIEGMFELDMAAKTYKADIKIPEPVQFPKLGSNSPTIDTSGTIKGELSASGSGLSLETSTGSAEIDLTHAKEPLPPIEIKSAITWKNGIISFGQSDVLIKDGVIKATGSVNMNAKKFDIQFDAKNAPLDGVFGRFDDINFHPIFGTADANATLTGWGKGFHVVGEAETTGQSGYFLITVEKARAKIDATYNGLNLTGDIDQRGKKTGDVDLDIKFGKKIEGQLRPKDIHLKAAITNHDLGPSFSAYKLSGIGNGTLVIDGPQRSFAGKIAAVINEGVFTGISFNKISANADMFYKKIKFTDGEFTMPNMKPVPFSSPIQMDFVDGGFHMYGHPLDTVTIDTDYKSQAGTWQIKKLQYHDLSVKGLYAPKSSSDMDIAGSIDAASLQVFKDYLREADGQLDVKLNMTGSSSNPNFYGKIGFFGNTIYPRMINNRLENVVGELIFDGHAIKSDSITGTVEDGDFVANGKLFHEDLQPQRFDISFNGRDLRYASEDRSFKAEISADVTWRGSKDNSKLEGDVTILDGRYTKDFVLLEGVTAKERKEEKEGLFNSDATHINLKVRNMGDLVIRNNIGNVWLKTDVVATGTTAHPLITGTIETNEGKLNFFGRDFTITKGFIEFHDPYTNPYLEIIAEHEVPTITDMVITATLHGRMNNLTLDLSSTKPLEKRDIVSLLLFGATESEMREAQWSSQLGPSVMASQVTHMIERPVTKATHLDIFRIEAAGGPASTTSADPSSQNTQISRMYLGKKLTDRLSVEFVTDVNTQDAQQTLRAEYLLTDFLLLKGERATGQKYKMNVLLRFRER